MKFRFRGHLLLAGESLQLEPRTHLAVSRGAFHVHGLHKAAIVVDVNLEPRHGGRHFALAARAHLRDDIFAVAFHFGRDKHVRHDVHVFDFGFAEHERDGHEVLETVKLTVDLADEILRGLRLFRRLGRSLFRRRVLQRGEQFFFFNGADQLVDNLAVFHQEKCRERLDRERSLDLFDARFVDAHRSHLDIGVVLRDADERRDHDKARRAARGRNFQDNRLFGLEDFFFEIAVVDLDDFDVFVRVCVRKTAHGKNGGHGEHCNGFENCIHVYKCSMLQKNFPASVT